MFKTVQLYISAKDGLLVNGNLQEAQWINIRVKYA